MTRTKRLDGGISICIPNWNHRNYLGRSLGSALRAARDLRGRGIGCQVVVVDDFSRDGSQRLLFSLSLQDDEGLLDVVLAPENRGLGATRNAALAHAKYSIVCFMDADNELIPENFFLFWKAIKETGAAFLYGNLISHTGERTTQILSNDVLREDIYVGNYIDAFALVNADIIEDLGGYYSKHADAHEDWELLLHLIAEHQTIVFVPLVLGYYHLSDLSMIRTTIFEHTKMHRVYAQRGTGFPASFKNRLMYHPEIGWL